jgi:hypothetical protein
MAMMLSLRSRTARQDVVLGDGPEGNAVPVEHAVPSDGARRGRVPQRAIEIEHDRVDH